MSQFDYRLTKENILDWAGLESIIAIDLNSLNNYVYTNTNFISITFTPIVALLLREFDCSYLINTYMDGQVSYVKDLGIDGDKLLVTYRNYSYESNTASVDDSTVFFSEMKDVEFKILLMRLKNFLMYSTSSIDRVMGYVDKVKSMQLY